MRIATNLPQVINRLKRLQTGLPQAVQRALLPKYLEPEFKDAALVTIRAQWVNERNVKLHELYERVTPQIVETVTGALLDDGASFSMRLPRESAPGQSADVTAASLFQQQSKTPTGREAKNFRLPLDEWKSRRENLEAARHGVLEWVRMEKKKDERDSGLSDEEIADRIEWILGIHKNTIPSQWSSEMQAAAANLVPHIQAFIDADAAGGVTRLQGAQTPVIDAATVHEWMVKVLAVWRGMVLGGALRHRIEVEIRHEFNRVRGTMV